MEQLHWDTDRWSEAREHFAARRILGDLAAAIGCSTKTVSIEDRFFSWLREPEHAQRALTGIAGLWGTDEDSVRKWFMGQKVPGLAHFLHEQRSLKPCNRCGSFFTADQLIPRLGLCYPCHRNKQTPAGAVWQRDVDALMPKVQDAILQGAWKSMRDRQEQTGEAITDKALAEIAGMPVLELKRRWDDAKLPRKRGKLCGNMACLCSGHAGVSCIDSGCKCANHNEVHKCICAPRRKQRTC